MDQVAHQVAGAFIGGQVIVETLEGGVRYARLLRGIAPVLDAVTRAEALELPQVQDIDLAGVARHRLGHAEHIGASGAQIAVPEEHIRLQFRIVPGETADIVTPDMPVGVIGMHDVAIVPEPVPLPRVYLVEIIVELVGQAVFDQGARWRRGIRQAPYTEQTIDQVQALGRHGQTRRGGDHLRHVGEALALRRGSQRPQGQFTGAGNAIGLVPAGLEILVGNVQALVLFGVGVHAAVRPVGPDIHGRGIR